MLQTHLINAFPQPELARLPLIAAAPWLAFLDNCSFHPLGRAALYWALQSLRSFHGSVAWLPPYHCGVEVQAAVEAGFTPRFYRLHSDLSVNEADLIRSVEENPGPIVLTHYFGFAQPCVAVLESLCKERGWILIEDCAHALFSADGHKSLGDYGQMAFYSFRKTLPAYEGAALKISRGDLRAKYHPVLKMRSLSTAGRFLRAEISRLSGDKLAARIRKALGRKDCDPGVLMPEPLEFGNWRDQRISPVSKRLLRLAKPAEIVIRRRKNYQTLDSLLSGYEGYQKVFDTLPLGVCPLCLPIRVSARPELLRELFGRGIRPYVFGAYPHPALPPGLLSQTGWMRDCIITLPVHQELEESDIIRVAETVGPLLRRHAPEDFRQTAERSFQYFNPEPVASF